MNQVQSIWRCVEMDAASRHFNYPEYLDYHRRVGCKSAVLSESNYNLVQQLFNAAMEEDISGN